MTSELVVFCQDPDLRGEAQRTMQTFSLEVALKRLHGVQCRDQGGSHYTTPDGFNIKAFSRDILVSSGGVDDLLLVAGRIIAAIRETGNTQAAVYVTGYQLRENDLERDY